MHLKHVKGLIAALAVSGFLNIILLTSLLYWQVKERPPALYCEQRAALHPRLSKQTPMSADEFSSNMILTLQTLPYEQLILKLKSQVPLENGYTERDLVLACLVAFHHFDLSRALGSEDYLLLERMVAYTNPSGFYASLKIFPSLNNHHFAAISAFAASERWPQTAKGLFLLLQKKKENSDKSLLDAFMLTPEFACIESLFRRLEPPIRKMEILHFLLQGDWSMMTKWCDQQRLHGDLSETRRQQILLEYMQKGSKAAEAILFKIDGHAKRITPSQQEQAQLKESAKSQENIRISKLEKKVAPPPPVQETSKSLLTSRPLKTDRLYIVQEGDTLWKLSMRFNVDVHVLKSYNKLTSDTLTPHSALRIPE